MSAEGKIPSFGATDLAMLSVVVIWGVSHTVVKSTLSEMTPLVFSSIRHVGAAAVLLVLAWSIERDLSIARSDWWWILLLGVIVVIDQTLYVTGIGLSTASNASLLLSTSPIFVALMSAVSRTETIHGWNWVGILLSFAGIFLVITGGHPDNAMVSQSLLGNLLVLASSVSWALYTVLSKRVTQRNSVLSATAWMMASAAPWFVLIAMRDLLAQDWAAVSLSGWMGLLYSATLAVSAAYVIWNVGVQRLGSARTSLYYYLVPVVAVMVAGTFLGETMEPLQVIGAIGVLLGVALGRYRPQS